MPIPKPEPNENRQAFVSRCMSNDTMKKEYKDSKQRVAICLGQTKGSEDCSLVENVHNQILAGYAWDDEWNEFVYDMIVSDVMEEDGHSAAAEYQGRKVTLNKPFRTPSGPKKFAVYVQNDKGKVVIVRFGDPNMKIKKNIPERRRSFRARHRCDQQKDKTTPAYWSCKMW